MNSRSRELFQFFAAVLLTATPVLADGGDFPLESGPTNSFPAQQRTASPERSQAAIGHYARAQKLMIEALREFDAAAKIARPDLVLSPEGWKSTVASKADELTLIIAPQARETSGGMRAREGSALIQEDFLKKKKSEVAHRPAVRPVQVAKKKKTVVHEQLVGVKDEAPETARARLADETKTEKIEVKTAQETPKSSSLLVVEPSGRQLETQEKAVEPELEKDVDLEMKKIFGEEAKSAEKKTSSGEESEPTTRSDEESETAAKGVREDEIPARLKKLSEEIAQEEQKAKGD